MLVILVLLYKKNFLKLVRYSIIFNKFYELHFIAFLVNLDMFILTKCTMPNSKPFKNIHLKMIYGKHRNGFLSTGHTSIDQKYGGASIT